MGISVSPSVPQMHTELQCHLLTRRQSLCLTCSVLSWTEITFPVTAMIRTCIHSLCRTVTCPKILVPGRRAIHSSGARLSERDFTDETRDRSFRAEFADRVFQDLKVDDYRHLIRGPEDEEIVKGIIADYEYLKYTTDRVPVRISSGHMTELMKMTNANEKLGYFNYLFKSEMSKAAAKRQRNQRGEKHMEKIRAQKDYDPGTLFDPETKEPVYRKWHNSLFMRIHERDMDKAHDHKKRIAAMCGQPFIVDFDFDRHMRIQELRNTCKQIAIAYGVNTREREPFDLWFCNYDQSSVTHEQMLKNMPNLMDANAMVTMTSGSYLDHFARERLVYLTPHAHHTLRDFSDDSIYIMAGLVDKFVPSPVTLAKAKREGLRMARLPLDDHVVWGNYSKVLTLNQIVGIMCQAKNNGGDWKDAFEKYVPKRKLKPIEELRMEEAVRIEKMRFRRKNMFRLD